MSELRRITERYRLDKLLAAGDGGSVFRATDSQSGETVAVKLINSEGAEAAEQHDRFLAACGTLQSRHRPGLPRVLDFGFTTAGTAFLVTEYLAAGSVEELAAAELDDLSAFRRLITAAPKSDPEGSFSSWIESRSAMRLGRSVPRETVFLSPPPKPTEEDPGNETRLILPQGEHTIAVPLGELGAPFAGADSGRTVRLDLSPDASVVPAPPSVPVLPPALPPALPPVLPPVLPPLPPAPPPLPRPAAQPAGNRTGLLLGVGALIVVMLLAVGLFWWRHRASQPPAPQALPAPALPTPSAPVIVPPAPTPAPVASPTPAEPAVPSLDVAGLKANLSRAMESGDLRLLRSVANSVSQKDEAGLPGAFRRDLERARRTLEADAKLQRAEKAGDRLDVIRQAAALLRELPQSAHAGELRDQAATAVEAEVDAAIDAGQYDPAASRLDELRQAYPERAGLVARTDRIAAEKKSDQEMETLLAAAGRFEKANKPLEGLQLLADAKPSRRYADRIQELKQRLTAQFAQADRQAPILVLRGSPEAEYEKGKTATISLRITDDFAVKSAEGWARAEGGQYAKVAVRHLSGADYAMDVSPELHQNKTIEFYVTAADPSGHTGQLGSAERPLKMKKKGLLKSIFGGKDEG
jgi:hypothetical protein